MAIKTPSILPDVIAFGANIGAVPYAQLMPAFNENFQILLDETEATGQTDGTVLVRFEVLVGRDNTYEKFTKLSVKVAPGPGPVSVVARRTAYDSLPYMIFGRLPEAPPAAAPVERTVDASQGTDDIVLDFDAEPVAAPDEAADRGFVPDTFEPLNVVERKEPDGVPIFKDLYSVGGPDVTADVVIAAVLEVIKPFAVRVSSKEELLAVIEKNPDLLGFMKDFGTDAEREALKGHLDRALARLSEPPREVRIPGGTGSPEARRRTPKAA
jgi:hypothetical protein